jgi:lysozyme family protein
MSSFDIAIPIVFKWESRTGGGKEGIIYNNPDDHGGTTNDFGITLKLLQSITSTATIDELKSMTREQAVFIYKKYFWLPNRYAEIKNQDIAIKVFDISVNMGAKNANICLQRAVRAASDNSVVLIEDGVIGIKTLTAVNNYGDIYLYGALKSEIAGMYRSFKQPANINGWLNRAYS